MAKNTDTNVTLTKPTGESATFGPMPDTDAALVALAAAAKGVTAEVKKSH